MLSEIKPALIIAWREIRDQFRDWRIIFPIVILTIFFPGLMNFTARQAVEFVQRYGANLVATRFIPFLLMIVGFFPITVSLVIALESFAGETERRSIEPLLSSPLTDEQLYWGKLLASLVPPVMGSYLGIFVYLIGVYRSIGWQVEPLFLLQIVCLTTVQALVMVSGAVVVSTQTTSVRAANLLSSFIVIPMALLIQGESIVMFWGSLNTLWWIILGQIIAAGLLIRAGIAHFNREELLGRELDILNLRKSWLIFRNAFVGEARNVPEWLFKEVARSMRKLLIPIVLSTGLIGVGLWVGFDLADRLQIPAELLNLDKIQDMNAGLVTGLRGMGFISIPTAFQIWLHNLRVVALATLAGIISFGVLGLLVIMLPLAMLGFFAQTATTIGLNQWSFLAAFTLPHGLLEFPAMILTAAMIFRLGATMVTPAKEKSLSAAWLIALADWAKVFLTIIAPLFLLAAFIEVFITPQTIAFFLK